jgi:hypothetical protein
LSKAIETQPKTQGDLIMKCSNCGIEFEGKFCHHCGTPAPSLTTDDSAQPLTTPSAPTPQSSSAPTPDDFSTHYDNEYAAQGSPDVDENRHVSDWNTPDSANSPEPQKKGKGCIIAVMVTIVALIIAFLVLLVFIVNGLSDFDLHTSAKVSQEMGFAEVCNIELDPYSIY